MKVALLISGLGPGGAERVISLLADALVDRGHDVWLITLAPSSDDFFIVDPRVHRIGLGLQANSAGVVEALFANVKRVRALRGVIATIEPHVVLSFVTGMNVLAILACTGLPAQVVVSERVDPASHREQGLWHGLRPLVYRRADALVVQTEVAARWFRERLGKRVAVHVIPNPVVTDARPMQLPLQVPAPFLLAAGRLVPQKGFDILIRAFAMAMPQCGQLRLAIAGEGPAGPMLRALAAELGADGRVVFLGRVPDLQTLMQQAQGFVLSSRYEGFPNVLLEALANRLPVAATDCPGGPREILHDGEFGLLVPCEDPVALGAALQRLATDLDLRRSLSDRAALAIAPYALTRVAEQWETVFRQQQPAGG